MSCDNTPEFELQQWEVPMVKIIERRAAKIREKRHLFENETTRKQYFGNIIPDPADEKLPPLTKALRDKIYKTAPRHPPFHLRWIFNKVPRKARYRFAPYACNKVGKPYAEFRWAETPLYLEPPSVAQPEHIPEDSPAATRSDTPPDSMERGWVFETRDGKEISSRDYSVSVSEVESGNNDEDVRRNAGNSSDHLAGNQTEAQQSAGRRKVAKATGYRSPYFRKDSTSQQVQSSNDSQATVTARPSLNLSRGSRDKIDGPLPAVKLNEIVTRLSGIVERAHQTTGTSHGRSQRSEMADSETLQQEPQPADDQHPCDALMPNVGDQSVEQEREWWARLAASLMNEGMMRGTISIRPESVREQQERLARLVLEYARSLPATRSEASHGATSSQPCDPDIDLTEATRLHDRAWWDKIVGVIVRRGVRFQLESLSTRREFGDLCWNFAKEMSTYADNSCCGTSQGNSSTTRLRSSMTEARHTPLKGKDPVAMSCLGRTERNSAPAFSSPTTRLSGAARAAMSHAVVTRAYRRHGR